VITDQNAVAHDGRPVYIRGKSLIGLMAAKHREAITTVRRCLAGEVGIVAGCEIMGIDQRTLRRYAEDWPELSAVVESGTISNEERARRGGLIGGPAMLRKRWGKKRKRVSK